MANALALRVLGAGHTGFSPGADGGRDGYFEGEAPYPSSAERWGGRWYLQAKFHRPHLSTDAQKWLLAQIRAEIDEFARGDSNRKWPDNWIVVTNIDPSGAPETGAFDQALKLVHSARPALSSRFHIWGGAKIIQLLAQYPSVSDYYAHFLTPGHVLTALYQRLGDEHASVRSIIRYFVVSQFNEQQYTKLEQAGSTADSRPGIQRLFTDLPFIHSRTQIHGMSASYMACAAANKHVPSNQILDHSSWREWCRHPRRARIWFVKGGPGQGKSTLTQYLAQVHRAALLLGPDAPSTTPHLLDVARDVQVAAVGLDIWPTAPRIPVYVELKDFAKWFGERQEGEPRGFITYLADKLTQRVEQGVLTGTIKRAFSNARWFFIFDGLDEVPSDVKDAVSGELTSFVDDSLIECAADAFIVCTSRPQGYSGQLASLVAAEVDLAPLKPNQALACAAPVLRFDRSKEESDLHLETLAEALHSQSVREIMTTPLQAHIMAVVVRDGGRPPDRKWRLFTNFYQVIKKREANRNLPDRRLSKLLRSGDKLIKSLHNRLGFELHARAEKSEGAQTSLARQELETIVRQVVSDLQFSNIQETVETLMEATTDRLVLVNTPDSGELVRFDIRPLQEFFAAEYIYEDTPAERLGERLAIVAGDAHWREVMHFLLSALIENSRQTDLAVAVDKLVQLNELGTGSPARTFFRRLAGGAILAARLLSEGVLDQDKRVRQQFKRCIEPLFATTDQSLSEQLSSIKGEDAVLWLVDVLVDTLVEQAESESVGAAAVLCGIVPDSHPRLREIEELIASKSESFRGCLLQILSTYFSDVFEDREIDEFRNIKCIGRIAFRSLMSPKWRQLGPRSIGAAFDLISLSGKEISIRAEEVGLEPKLAKLCEALSGDSGEPRQRKVAGGLMELRFNSPGSNLNFTEWPKEVLDVLDRAPGVFSMIKPVMALATGDRSIQTIASLRGAGASLSGIGWQWRYFLPEELQEETSQFYRYSDVLVPQFNWRHPVGCRVEYHFVGEDIPDLDELLQKYGGLTLSAILQGYGPMNSKRFKKMISSHEGAAKIAEFCKANPRVVANLAGGWGRLIELCERHCPVREVLLASLQFWSEDDAYFGNIYPFELDLSGEGSLFPPILDAITGARSTYKFRSNRQLPLDELVKKYVPNPDMALQLALNAVEPETRGSAAMICLIHPDVKSVKYTTLVDIIGQNYRPEVNSWYLRAAAVAMDRMISTGELYAINVMGAMLRMGSGDYRSRLKLNVEFDRWRQISRAPVSSYGIQKF